MSSDLFVKLGLKSDQYQSGMNKAGRTAKDFEKSILSMNSVLKVSGAIIGAVGFAKIIGETKDFIKESALLSSRFTTLNVVLENVGKNIGVSSKQMTEHADALRSTGISAIESRATLVRLAQANIDLSQSSKLARIAQDAAVIGNINSSEAFQRMTHGIQSAQIEVLRTIGINVNFENSYKRLAKELGKNTNELTEQEKVQARVNVVMEAGKNIAGTYEAAMSTAGKQLNSMTRYVEDFKVEFGKAFEPAVVILVKSATEAIKDLSEVVQGEGFRSSVQDMATGTAKFVSQLAKIPKHIDDIKAVYDQLPEAAKGVEGLGIVGLMLFGGKYGQIAGMLIALEKTLNQMQLYGPLTIQTPAELEALKSIQERRNPPDTVSTHGGAWPQTTVSSRDKWESSYTDLWLARDKGMPAPPAGPSAKELKEAEKVAEEIKNNWRNIFIDMSRFEDQQNEDREKAMTDMAGTENQINKEVRDNWVNILNSETEYYENQEKERNAILKRYTEEGKKLAGDKSTAFKNMYNDMDGNAKVYYDYQLGALNKQRDEYEKLVGKNAVTDAWYAKKKKDLDQQLILSGNNFFKGIQIGYEKSLKSAMTFAKTGEDVFKSFTDQTTSMLSDNFFNIFTGQMDQLQWDWDQMWQGMARTASSRLAQMATDKIIDTAISAAGTGLDLLGESMGWWSAGSWDIKKNQMAVLHKGEMVVPAWRAEQIRSGGDDAALGESYPSDPGGPAPGTGAYAVAQAIGESLKSSAIGFGRNKAIGWATTGNLAMGLNPMGVLGALAKAMASGGYAAYNAYKDFKTIYGKQAPMDWGADLLGRAMPYGKISLEDMQKNFDMWGMGTYNPRNYAGSGGGDGSYGSSLGTDSGDPEHGGAGLSGSVAKHGGWLEGPMSGYKPTLHGRELVLNEDQVKAVRELNAGGGRQQPVQIIIENSGVITTGDVDAWLADRLQRLNDYRAGAGVTQRRSVTAGVSL